MNSADLLFVFKSVRRLVLFTVSTTNLRLSKVKGGKLKKIAACACSKLILHSCSVLAKMERQSVSQTCLGFRTSF